MQTHSSCFLVLVRMALKLTWLCYRIKTVAHLESIPPSFFACHWTALLIPQGRSRGGNVVTRGYNTMLGIGKLLFFQTICCNKTNCNHSSCPTRPQTDISLFFGLLLSPGLSWWCWLCSPGRKLIQGKKKGKFSYFAYPEIWYCMHSKLNIEARPDRWLKVDMKWGGMTSRLPIV